MNLLKGNFRSGLFLMMLLALAACQPKEQVPEATEQIVVITATQAETRTVVGENSMGGRYTYPMGNQ